MGLKRTRGLIGPAGQMRGARWTLPLWLTAVLVSALGCSSNPVSPTSAGVSSAEVLSPADVVLEIKAESKSLQLAPGWTWPTDVTPQSHGPDGRPVRYQAGYGTTWADHYWYCSWEWRLVKGGLNATDLSHTLEMLASVRSKEYYLVAVDPIDKVKFDNELNAATKGSLGSMQNDVALNCPAPPS